MVGLAVSKGSTMESLIIKSKQGDYPVYFYSKLQESLVSLNEQKPSGFVIDKKVAELYKNEIPALTQGAPVFLIEATEEEKSIDGVKKVNTWMQKMNFNKSSIVCAVGGGIIQDIATLAAHVYYRGIKLYLFPTTLLSMADSCIGAKCGVNLNEFKNQIGAFHSPAKVFICTDFINTLSDFDVISGYGEILKLHLTSQDWIQFKELENSISAEGYRSKNLSDLIYKSLLVKKAVIEEDEYETNLRRILNYGHTFGHALESITNHEVPHGQAVAWGMDLVNYIACKKGLLSTENFLKLNSFIKKYFPIKISRSVEPSDLINGAKRDKKASAGSVNLILLDNNLKLNITKVNFDDKLEEHIVEYMTKYNVIG